MDIKTLVCSPYDGRLFASESLAKNNGLHAFEHWYHKGTNYKGLEFKEVTEKECLSVVPDADKFRPGEWNCFPFNE
jgi:hypothetical protein